MLLLCLTSQFLPTVGLKDFDAHVNTDSAVYLDIDIVDVHDDCAEMQRNRVVPGT